MRPGGDGMTKDSNRRPGSTSSTRRLGILGGRGKGVQDVEEVEYCTVEEVSNDGDTERGGGGGGGGLKVLDARTRSAVDRGQERVEMGEGRIGGLMLE